MRKMQRALLGGIILLGSGCTMAKISGRSTTPLLLNNPTQRVEVVQHFAESKRITFDYTSAFDVSEVLGNVINSNRGDAVANLTITVESDVTDFFINLFTLGFAQAKTFKVEGDLVKTSRAAGAIGAADIIERSGADGSLKAKLQDFSGNPSDSPIVMRSGNELALVRVHR